MLQVTSPSNNLGLTYEDGLLVAKQAQPECSVTKVKSLLQNGLMVWEGSGSQASKVKPLKESQSTGSEASTVATPRPDWLSDAITEVVPPIMGSPTPISRFEFSEMLRRHQLLGPYCFSPLSELVANPTEDEVLMLN